MTTSRTFRALSIAGLVYIVLRPVSANEILVPVLAGMGLIATVGATLTRRRLAPELYALIHVQVVFGLLFSLVAAINNNPGLWPRMLVYLAAPVLFWTWVRAIDEHTLKLSLHWIAIATILLATGIVIFVVSESGVISFSIPEPLVQEQGAGFDSSSSLSNTRIRFFGLSSLAAAGPMWTASLFLKRDRLLPNTWLRLTAATMSLIAALGAGRRAIVIAIVLAPILLGFCRIVLGTIGRGNRRSNSLFVGAFALAAVFILGSSSGLLTLDTLSSPFVDAHDFAIGDATPSDSRAESAGKLLGGWAESPILGSGFGATIDGFARNAERPWDFELQYHLLLFETGALGAILIIAAFVVALAAFREAARKTPTMANTLALTMTGALAILVTNAADPYLQVPGHIWWLYLPLCVANLMLLGERSITGPSRKPDQVRASS